MAPAPVWESARVQTPAPVVESAEPGARVTPKTSLFICHTFRCGSTLLCDVLGSTGIAGCAEEYFPHRGLSGKPYVMTGAALRDPDTWRSDWAGAPFEQCLDQVLTNGTTQNGVFASKVKWANMSYLGEALTGSPRDVGLSLAERLDSRFPDLRYVWVTRRNKVRQAVSLVKASQSQEWKATDSHPRHAVVPEYNFHIVDAALRWIVREECAWEQYFTRTGLTPFTVVYEDLVPDHESTVRRLLDHLQIDLPSDYVFPTPRLHKQADAVSDEWVERYERDARARRTWRGLVNLPPLVINRTLRETYVLPRLHAHLDCVRETGKQLTRGARVQRT